MKKKVAIFLGGRSPEHDISVITGLQAFHAIDHENFEAFPVYIAPGGEWLVGKPLGNRKNYLPSVHARSGLTEVTLNLNSRKPELLPRRSSLLCRKQPICFDVALLALHGLFGEDGRIQGLLEIANVPYTGMRTLASSVLMDKIVTKKILSHLSVPLLPYAVVKKPNSGLVTSLDELECLLKAISFPCCVKPCHLGSSIGVAKVNTLNELQAVLPLIFKLDYQAIVEPFVENLVEYNVAVTTINGETQTSAIECPQRSAEMLDKGLLDFKQKYLSGQKNQGSKMSAEASQGMLSLTREINPKISKELEGQLRNFATMAFLAVDGTGAPRFDFLLNNKTGDVWLNEVNPCPGSFGYFLWEAADEPMLFVELLSKLIEEATILHQLIQLPDDPVPNEARLFTRQ